MRLISSILFLLHTASLAITFKLITDGPLLGTSLAPNEALLGTSLPPNEALLGTSLPPNEALLGTSLPPNEAPQGTPLNFLTEDSLQVITEAPPPDPRLGTLQPPNKAPLGTLRPSKIPHRGAPLNLLPDEQPKKPPFEETPIAFFTIPGTHATAPPNLSPDEAPSDLSQKEAPSVVLQKGTPLDLSQDEERSSAAPHLAGEKESRRLAQEGRDLERFLETARLVELRAFEYLVRDDWQILINKRETGDQVAKITGGLGGRIYRLKARLQTPVRTIFEDLRDNMETAPTWNPTLQYHKILKQIDDQNRVIYQRVAQGASSLFSGREFLNLETYKRIGNSYFFFYSSIDFFPRAVEPGFVRAENGPSVIVLKSLTENETEIQWLLNTDFKFNWFIRAMSDQIFPKVLLNYVYHLRLHVQDLNGRGSQPQRLSRSDPSSWGLRPTQLLYLVAATVFWAFSLWCAYALRRRVLRRGQEKGLTEKTNPLLMTALEMRKIPRSADEEEAWYEPQEKDERWRHPSDQAKDEAVTDKRIGGPEATDTEGG